MRKERRQECVVPEGTPVGSRVSRGLYCAASWVGMAMVRSRKEEEEERREKKKKEKDTGARGERDSRVK